MSDPTILFYRFGFASIILAIVMLIRRISFKVTRGELVTLIYLAFISDGSALFLIDGYNYMSSGVATTLHFMYPVVTAIIMMTFYNEARRLSTILAVCMAVGGVGILSWDPTGNTSVRGVIIVLVSAVCYALYLIRVNRSRAATMNSSKLVFYVMFIGALILELKPFAKATSPQSQPTYNGVTLPPWLSSVRSSPTSVWCTASNASVAP